MPDNFQDYSHYSHPSPSTSSDAHSSNGDAASTASSSVGGFTEWIRDPSLDAIYSSEFMDGMTEEEIMECLASIPVEELLPQPQTIPPHLLHSYRNTQNVHTVHNPASSASTPMMVAQPNLSNIPHSPFNAVGTWSASQSQQFFSSPQQAPPSSRQLPHLRPVMLPTSPISQASSSSSVGPPGDTQRLSLPAPGDMNYSSCEVIM